MVGDIDARLGFTVIQPYYGLLRGGRPPIERSRLYGTLRTVLDPSTSDEEVVDTLEHLEGLMDFVLEMDDNAGSNLGEIPRWLAALGKVALRIDPGTFRVRKDVLRLERMTLSKTVSAGLDDIAQSLPAYGALRRTLLEETRSAIGGRDPTAIEGFKTAVIQRVGPRFDEIAELFRSLAPSVWHESTALENLALGGLRNELESTVRGLL